ncbi:hypothetical protein K8I31_03405, partial [bacterium]|nr:hypothetical protein [bacterium]
RRFGRERITIHRLRSCTSFIPRPIFFRGLKCCDLNEKVDSILHVLEIKGYGNTNRATILKAISAIELNSIQDRSLRTLRELPTNIIDELVGKTKQSLLNAVDVLSTQFRILSWDFLSYEAVLVITTYIFRNTNQLNADQSTRLKQWFWRSSLGERYKVGGENFVSKDMQFVSEYVLEGKGNPENFGNIPTPDEWRESQFRSNVARSRAFILVLASKNPKNLPNGLNIDLDNALSLYNKKEYHHFYPRAHLKSLGKNNFSNVLSNIIMLTSGSNKSISDKAPSVYSPLIVDNLGENADAVYESNLLPLPSKFDYENRNYEDFLSERGKILTSYVNSFL